MGSISAAPGEIYPDAWPSARGNGSVDLNIVIVEMGDRRIQKGKDLKCVGSIMTDFG